MFLQNTENFLDNIKERFEATSCTFYIRDPVWSDELRLVAMPGVKLTEPMHGFSFSLNSQELLTDELKIFQFDSDTENNQQFDLATGKIASEHRHLFGNFVKREGIKSSIRLVHIVDKRVEALLFVNFDTVKEFDETLKTKIKLSFEQLVTNLPSLYEELASPELENVNQMIQILSSAYTISKNIVNNLDQSLESYLKALLETVMENLPEIKSGDGFGTIRRYEAETETLRLVAYSDNIKAEQVMPRISIYEQKGIVSWVAIQQQAVLINDLHCSEFSSIYRSADGLEGIRSEIVIPIFAGNEFIGTLNLESFLPNVFQPIYVRLLWFAVSQAAMVCKISEQADINARLKNLSDDLLNLCEDWINQSSIDFSLNKLTKLATKNLNASRCEIWNYDQMEDSFSLAGINHTDFKPDQPRSSGMSQFIKSNKCEIWLAEIESEENFQIYYWENDAWNQDNTNKKCPVSVNSSVITYGVKSLLGIPIIIKGKFNGVTWLEYTESKIPPSNDYMKLAKGFAAHAGLGIEFSRVDLVDKDAVQNIGKTISENILVAGEMNFRGFPKLEGYVKSNPYSNSSIGGDFFAAHVIDERTACVLLGDGQGHAVNGALNMIPMITVFETFWKESRSVTHIMDKIMSMSTKLGVRGTATYCVFSIIEKRLWLSVTSAGHDPLIIFPKNGIADEFPPQNSLAKGPILGVQFLERPLTEEHRELNEGELIILFTDGLNLSTHEIAPIGLSHKEDELQLIAEEIFDKARNKCAPNPLDDDATVIVLRVKK